jgi:hypothetical protein
LLKIFLVLILMLLHLKILDSCFLCLAERHYRKALLGDNPCFISVIFLLLSLGSCYLCNNLSLSFLFHFCAKNSL